MHAGQAPDSKVWRARVNLHTGMHLAVRTWNAVSPLGLAQSDRLRALLTVSAAADLAEATWMARDPRPHEPLRLLLRSLDAAAWAAAEPQETRSYTVALLPGVALALESGYRGSWRSAVVPVTTWAAAACARRAVGKSVEPAEMVWQSIAAAGGQAVRWYERRTVDRALGHQRRTFEPEILAAELDAEAALLVRETVADDLQGIALRTSLLQPRGGDPLVMYRMAQGLKSRHATDVDRSASVYAKTLAQSLEVDRNAATPRVRDWLEIRFETAEDSMRILSPAQARWLARLLVERAPRGSVTTVAFVNPGPRQGRRGLRQPDLVARVNGEEHATPARIVALGLLPVGWLAGAIICLTVSLDNQVAVPLPVTGTVAAVGLAAAALAARDPSNDGADMSTRVAAAMPLLMATAGTVTMRNHHRDGVSRVNVTSLSAYAMTALYTWPRLRVSTRAAVIVSTVSSVVGAWALAPRPRSARAFASEGIWPAAAILVAYRVRAAINREANRQTDLLAQELRQAKEAAAGRALGTVAAELGRTYRRCRDAVERARTESGASPRAPDATERQALVDRLTSELDEVAPRLALLEQDTVP